MTVLKHMTNQNKIGLNFKSTIHWSKSNLDVFVQVNDIRSGKLNC